MSYVCFIIINPLTARVIGAPQMILQPVFSIFPLFPLPSGTRRTPGLSIPWCCPPTSSSVYLVFFPLSLCLARWFWPDLMIRKHDLTTAVCISLWSSGGLCVIQLPAGSWHRLPRWWHGLCMWCIVSCSSTSLHGSYSSFQLCCEGPWFASIQEDGCDKEAHQSYLETERNAPIDQRHEACDCLKLVTVSSFCLFTMISLLMPLVSLVINLLFSALISMLKAVEALLRCSTNFASSSSPAKPSMSSGKQRLVIVLLPVLTVPLWSYKMSFMILSRNILKRVGESRHPCWTPTVVQNQSPMLPLKRTALVVLSYRFLMTRIRLVLMYFFMDAHKAACQTLSKTFLEMMRTGERSCWCWRYFSQRIHHGLLNITRACLLYTATHFFASFAGIDTEPTTPGLKGGGGGKKVMAQTEIWTQNLSIPSSPLC